MGGQDRNLSDRRNEGGGPTRKREPGERRESKGRGARVAAGGMKGGSTTKEEKGRKGGWEVLAGQLCCREAGGALCGGKRRRMDGKLMPKRRQHDNGNSERNRVGKRLTVKGQNELTDEWPAKEAGSRLGQDALENEPKCRGRVFPTTDMRGIEGGGTGGTNSDGGREGGGRARAAQ